MTNDQKMTRMTNTMFPIYMLFTFLNHLRVMQREWFHASNDLKDFKIWPFFKQGNSMLVQRFKPLYSYIIILSNLSDDPEDNDNTVMQ